MLFAMAVPGKSNDLVGGQKGKCKGACLRWCEVGGSSTGKNAGSYCLKNLTLVLLWFRPTETACLLQYRGSLPIFSS